MTNQSGDNVAAGNRAQSADAVRISWALGTAYDFFASLFMIHNAESTGLRRAWAAGVRNRVSVRHRELLQQIIPMVTVPVEWIGHLGDNPDGQTVLTALRSLPDHEVLPALLDRELVESTVISRVMAQESFSQSEIDLILKEESLCTLMPSDPRVATAMLELFANPAGSGALVKTALAEYYERFFKEEELRIANYLSDALEQARGKAKRGATVDLVEELSGGLRLEHAAEATGLLLIPSFWVGPLVLFEKLPDGTWVILFSARPRDVSLIPGDPVPDALTRSLQAVSDQTRLRILKLLSQSPRTQIEIARELRLRPPTITHHLKILRLANLVRLTESTECEKRYDVRGVRLRELSDDLLAFVGID
ncbi:MAG: transcriptional regulator [Spirochaetales bacterium]|nr:transcriptional regulator [Spirochaetales bacterium]